MCQTSSAAKCMNARRGSRAIGQDFDARCQNDELLTTTLSRSGFRVMLEAMRLRMRSYWRWESAAFGSRLAFGSLVRFAKEIRFGVR